MSIAFDPPETDPVAGPGLQQEIQDRQDADSELSDRLDSEAIDRGNEDAALSGRISDVEDSVGAEATARADADELLIPLTQKGAALGVASLDGAGKVPFSQLPASIFEYKGTWNASTNSPTLADGTGTAGWLYRVTVAGSRNLGSGSITFAVGDYVIHNGTTWEKADTTDAVSSVNGRQGDVTGLAEQSALTTEIARAQAAEQTAVDLAGTTAAGLATEVARATAAEASATTTKRLLAAVPAECLDANIRAASGGLTRQWIQPGSNYTTGQWLWDSAFAAVVAAGYGRGAEAQTWLRNWPDHQLGNGMYPMTLIPGGDNISASQAPVMAWAVYQVYLSTLDASWLATMYTSLKLYYGWWETYRDDSSGLASWGSSRTGSPSQGQVEQDARYESGQDQHPLFQNGAWATANGMTIDHAGPDLNALLVNEANALSLIATALGQTSQATTYATKRDTRKALMNSLMWDAEYGRYCPVQRADLAVGLGNLGAQATSGATSITLASALTTRLVAGTPLLFGTQVVQVGTAGAASGATSVPLMSATTATVANGTAVTMRPHKHMVTLADVAMPLWAGVPSSANARILVDEHLTKVYDGTTPEVWDCYFGSGHHGNFKIHAKRDLWYFGPMTTQTFLTIQADSITHPSGTNGGQMLQIWYRGRIASGQRNMQYRDDWERPARFKPLTLVWDWIQSAAGNAPQIVAADYPANTNKVNSVLSSGVSVGAAATSQAEWADVMTGVMNVTLRQSGSTADLVTKAVHFTVYPFGFVHLSPHGLVYPGRLHNVAYSPPDDTARSDTQDYWAGDHWLNIEYMAIQGLLSYGMQATARDVADRVVRRVYNDWAQTGRIYERWSMRGRGKGSTSYAWSGLVANIVRLFNL